MDLIPFKSKNNKYVLRTIPTIDLILLLSVSFNHDRALPIYVSNFTNMQISPPDWEWCKSQNQKHLLAFRGTFLLQKD